ncbi:MAG: transposase [Methylococcales bacterium]|nr:transposase [Methylococcales bacterium]
MLDDAIKQQDRRMSRLCRNNELSKRFPEVPGVGPMTATIIASAIGDGKRYVTNSRDYAAGSGIVPPQYSSGDKLIYFA